MIDHDCIDRILALLSLYWHAKPEDHFDEVVLPLLTESHCTTEAEVEDRLRAAIAALDFKPIARHPAGCVAHSNEVGAWLRDGTKVVLQRDSQTMGRAWLEVEKQATVHLAEEKTVPMTTDELLKNSGLLEALKDLGPRLGDAEQAARVARELGVPLREPAPRSETTLAPDPPHDPMGLEMCRGITPPQEDDPLADLKRCIEDIKAGKEPEASPEMWALAEEACANRPKLDTPEEVEGWAKRLAGGLVDAGMKDDARAKKLQALFDQMHDHISLVYARTEGDPPEDDYESRPKKVVAVLAFSMKGYGFGELTFVTDETGQTYIDTECTSREHVKEMLGWLVDHAIIDHETDPEKHLKYNEVRGSTCGEGCAICNPKEEAK